MMDLEVNCRTNLWFKFSGTMKKNNGYGRTLASVSQRLYP